MTWSPCVSGAAYTIGIDWNEDGSFTGFDDLTTDVLDQGISSTYGRDQVRQLSPSKVGDAAFSVCNVSRVFSPENQDSPLFDQLGAARPTRIEVIFENNTYPIHSGRVDDFSIHADFSNRTVDFTSLDGLALLQNTQISTSVYRAQRTGFLINQILNLIGWTAPRSIDVGANRPPFWWIEGQDAFGAVNDLVLSEGPPAIAYVAPDGTFVFRDRHHRIQDERSLTSQAFFNANEISCETPPVSGFSYTPPFTYEHGWRDIINHVTQDITVRTPAGEDEVVWSDEGTYTISSGETLVLEAVANDPFIMGIRPDPDVDFGSISGVGTLSVMLGRSSGQSTSINLTAVGGSVTFTYIQFRARPVSSGATIKVEEIDSGSVSQHGRKTYPNDLPWVDRHNALAVALIILAHYAQRRPIVQMRLSSCDPEHFLQILTRTISDRITIRNGELGLFDDFFIESVAHSIVRINPDQPPVHSVVLGCERDIIEIENCFTFDVVGKGFDQGAFCGQGQDDPDTVFIFDDPQNGQFDYGVFGT
jgi:hypothetical protein